MNAIHQNSCASGTDASFRRTLRAKRTCFAGTANLLRKRVIIREPGYYRCSKKQRYKAANREARADDAAVVMSRATGTATLCDLAILPLLRAYLSC